MSLDELLLWLSAKDRGSWSQFRAAVETIGAQDEPQPTSDQDDEGVGASAIRQDLAIYQSARFVMQRLSHVEFFTADTPNGWRVSPPALAFVSGLTSEGILCGARSTALLERLRELDHMEVFDSDSGGMLQRIVVRGSTDLSAIGALGIHVQTMTPLSMLSVTPTVGTWHGGTLSETPETPGWTTHRFSAARLQWEDVSLSETRAPRGGLFRFVLDHQRFYYLRRRGRCHRLPVQLGKYAVMNRREGRVGYDSRRFVFSVPVICRPPLLIERALILCSGQLPTLDGPTGRLEYHTVPHDVARLAGQVLGQEFV